MENYSCYQFWNIDWLTQLKNSIAKLSDEEQHCVPCEAIVDITRVNNIHDGQIKDIFTIKAAKGIMHVRSQERVEEIPEKLDVAGKE